MYSFLILGASSGIGAATAIHFADLGAILSITGRNAENLQHTLANCKKPESGDHLAIIGMLFRNFWVFCQQNERTNTFFTQ